MAKHFRLVDAPNGIFARPELTARHGSNPGAAREELVRLLERHQDASGVRVVVVFDGGAGSRVTSEVSGGAGSGSAGAAPAAVPKMGASFRSTSSLSLFSRMMR